MVRFKLDISPDWLKFDGIPEDPNHVSCHCPRFIEERRKLEQTLVVGLVPENVIQRMLATQEDWDAINSII